MMLKWSNKHNLIPRREGRSTLLVVHAIDVQQYQLNNERMKDENAAITLLENNLKKFRL